MKMHQFLVLLIALSWVSFNTYSQAGKADSQLKNNPMKQFSMLVRVPDTYTSEHAKTIYPQWEKLLAQWKADGVYVLSFAFPGESHTVSGPEKTVRKESVLSGNLRVVSNIVLQAETLERALELAKAVPILFYGGNVEIREIPQPLEFKK
jgi:hypothetical protein